MYSICGLLSGPQESSIDRPRIKLTQLKHQRKRTNFQLKYMTAMISLGANYRICLLARMCVCVTKLEEGNVCFAHPSISVPTEIISWIIGVFSPKKVCRKHANTP